MPDPKLVSEMTTILFNTPAENGDAETNEPQAAVEPAEPAETTAPTNATSEAPSESGQTKPDKAPQEAPKDVLEKIIPKDKQQPPPAKTELPEEQPKGKDAGSLWKNLRSTLKSKEQELESIKPQLQAKEKELAELRAAMEQAQKANTSGELELLKDQIKTLKEQLAERDRVISAVKVEHSPKFKEAVAAPLQAAEKRISELAKRYGVKPSLLLEIADEPDQEKRITLAREAGETWHPTDLLRLENELDNVSSLRAKRDELLKSAPDVVSAWEKEMQESTEKQRQQFMEESKVAFQKKWADFQKQVPLFTESQDGSDAGRAWNKMLAQLQADAIEIDSKPLSHEERAELTYKALAFDPFFKIVQKTFAAMSEEINQLRKRDAATREGQIDLGSGSTGTSENADEPLPTTASEFAGQIASRIGLR
jgi:transposase-like protein